MKFVYAFMKVAHKITDICNTPIAVKLALKVLFGL